MREPRTVELTTEIRVWPPGSADRRPGHPVDHAYVASVVWTVPRSGLGRWIVDVVVEPATGGGPRGRQRAVLPADGRQHVVDVQVEGDRAERPAGTFRGLATLHRGNAPAGGPAVAAFTELGTFRFGDARHPAGAPAEQFTISGTGGRQSRPHQ